MKRTMLGGRCNWDVHSPVRRSACRVMVAAFLLAACAPGFQVKKYHTNPDLFDASLQEYNRKKWDNAITGFERLTLDLTPRDSLLSRAHWYLAKAHEERGEHLLAATGFLRLAELFPDDSLADDALLAAGDSYSRLWRSPGLDPQYGTLAQMQYRLLGSIYPDSPLRAKAQAAALAIDEMLATKEYDTGQHYVRRRAFDSAIISYKFVVKEYPNTQHVRDALMRMVEVYRRPELKYVEEAKETCATLRSAYPSDGDVTKLCPAPVETADSAAKPAPAVPPKPKPAP
jgi:outer membrane protein assembly factor BamD